MGLNYGDDRKDPLPLVYPWTVFLSTPKLEKPINLRLRTYMSKQGQKLKAWSRIS